MNQFVKLHYSILLLTALTLTLSLANAQEDKVKRPSPPAQAQASVGGKTITIDYGQPSAKGRPIWGKLVPYGQVWRAGANESTVLTVSEAVLIEGQPLSAGRYALFVIPNETQWTIVINKTPRWGAFSYKPAEDVLRVNVPVKPTTSSVELLTYKISANGDVTLAWADRQATFAVR